MYTLGSAYACFEEGSRGSIEVGKAADLAPLAGDGHGVALGLLARAGAAFLHQACPLEYPIDTKDAEWDVLLGLSSRPGGVARSGCGVAPTCRGQDPFHCGPGNGPGVSVGPAGTVPEGVKVPLPLLVAMPPLVEGLAADAVALADMGHRSTPLVHLDPRQPLLDDILPTSRDYSPYG